MDLKEIAALFEANRRLTVSRTSALPRVEICIGDNHYEDTCTVYGLIPYVKKLFLQLSAMFPKINLQLRIDKDVAQIVPKPN